MKKQFVLLFMISSIVLSAQSYSSNYRRVSREVEKVMSISSDIIDGVMTYEKEKKVLPLIEEQFSTYRKSKRSFARLTEPSEAALIEVVNQELSAIIELSSTALKDWLGEDPRSGFGHEYVDQTIGRFEVILQALETYSETHEVNVRGSEVVDRLRMQKELLSYTKEMKRGAFTVDSLVDVLKGEVGHTDLDLMYSSQKALVKALSRHLRGYGEEMYFNGQTQLHEAYQKYYFELLELASADLLADLTKMKYDLVEFNSIAKSTEASARKTLSFFDNEKKLLAKREARFVKGNLPKAPKK